MAVVLSNPSSLLHEIQLEKVGTWNLFKFSKSQSASLESLDLVTRLIAIGRR
jgi:hypothetical protein